jgi:hypothetical protein
MFKVLSYLREVEVAASCLQTSTKERLSNPHKTVTNCGLKVTRHFLPFNLTWQISEAEQRCAPQHDFFYDNLIHLLKLLLKEDKDSGI